MGIQSNKRQNENQLHSSLQPEFCASACCIKLMICTVTSSSLRQALDVRSLWSESCPTELEILVFSLLWKPEQHKTICCVQSVGLHVFSAFEASHR